MNKRNYKNNSKNFNKNNKKIINTNYEIEYQINLIYLKCYFLIKIIMNLV